jgi:hypothetical protein
MDQAIWASGTAPKDLLDWTYRAARAVASDNLALGWDIIADCVNDCEEARNGWDEIGRRNRAKVIWLEIVGSDPVEHRQRVEIRSSDITGLVLPDWETVIRRSSDDWSRTRLVVDTAHRSLETCVDEVLTFVRR